LDTNGRAVTFPLAIPARGRRTTADPTVCPGPNTLVVTYRWLAPTARSGKSMNAPGTPTAFVVLSKSRQCPVATSAVFAKASRWMLSPVSGPYCSSQTNVSIDLMYSTTWSQQNEEPGGSEAWKAVAGLT